MYICMYIDRVILNPLNPGAIFFSWATKTSYPVCFDLGKWCSRILYDNIFSPDRMYMRYEILEADEKKNSPGLRGFRMTRSIWKTSTYMPTFSSFLLRKLSKGFINNYCDELIWLRDAFKKWATLQKLFTASRKSICQIYRLQSWNLMQCLALLHCNIASILFFIDHDEWRLTTKLRLREV